MIETNFICCAWTEQLIIQDLESEENTAGIDNINDPAIPEVRVEQEERPLKGVEEVILDENTQENEETVISKNGIEIIVRSKTKKTPILKKAPEKINIDDTQEINSNKIVNEEIKEILEPQNDQFTNGDIDLNVVNAVDQITLLQQNIEKIGCDKKNSKIVPEQVAALQRNAQTLNSGKKYI